MNNKVHFILLRPGFNSRQRQWREFFSSPQRSDRLWGPPRLLSNGNVGHLLWGQSGSSVKPWLRMPVSVPPLCKCVFMACCLV